MKCPECHTQNEHGKAFCHRCGARLVHVVHDHPVSNGSVSHKSENATTNGDNPQMRKHVSSPVHNKKSNKRTVVSFGVGVASLIIGFSFFWGVSGTLPYLGAFPFRGLFQRILGPQSVLDIVPESADVVMTVGIDDQNTQFQNAKSVFLKFQDSGLFPPQFLESVGLSREYESDMLDSLGDEIAFYIDFEHMQSFDESFNGDIGYVVHLEDTDLAAKTLGTIISDAGARNTKVDYGDVSYHVIESRLIPNETLVDENTIPGEVNESEVPEFSRGYYAIYGEFLVVTENEDGMKLALDDAQNGTGFSTRSDVADILSHSSENAFMRMIIDPASLLEVGSPTTSFLGLFSYDTGGDIDTVKSYYGLTMGELIFDTETIRLDLYGDFSRPELEAYGIPFLTETFEPTMLQYFPNDPIVYLETRSFKTLFTYLSSVVAASPDSSVDVFMREVADVSSLLQNGTGVIGSSTGMALSVHEVDEKKYISIGLDVTDVPEVNKKAFIEALLPDPDAGDLNNTAVEETVIGERKVYTIHSTVLPESADISFGFVGNAFIISSGVSGIVPFLEVADGERMSMVADSGYNLVRNGVLGDTSLVLYMNTAEAMFSLGSYLDGVSLDTQNPRNLWSDFFSRFSPLGSGVISLSSDSSSEHLRIFLHYK